MKNESIAIIGGGCYGTALANCFSQVSKTVKIIEPNHDILKSINEFHKNLVSLPDIKLNNNILVSNSYNDIIDSQLVFIAVPAKFNSYVLDSLRKIKITVPIVICSKGFDLEKHQLLFRLFETNLKNPIAVFSGPSFAMEIATNKPAIVNIAANSLNLAKTIAEKITTNTLKVLAIDDPIGLSLVGALKNVLAICCGILSGKDLGNSAIASIISLGIEEMKNIIIINGGNPNTIYKVGAIGDIILTCKSLQSRNMSFGKHLSQGGTVYNWTGGTIEGVDALKMIPIICKNIDANIFSNIYKFVYENISIDSFIKNIFS